MGILGLAAFAGLRSSVDYNANGPIEESRAEVEERLTGLSGDLGFSMDSLEILSVRQQHIGFLKSLEDTLKQNLSPAEMNERGAHIQSWLSVIGVEGDGLGTITGPGSLFETNGRLLVRTSNSGRIIRILDSDNFPNPTFIRGDSLQNLANRVVGEILGYDLTEYELVESSEDTLTAYDEGIGPAGIINGENVANETLEINWRRKSDNISTPEFLSLSLKPVVREYGAADNFRTEFGFQINSFSARNQYEPFSMSDIGADLNVTAFALFSAVLLLLALAFIFGLNSIFKGKVEWKRVLFLFLVSALGVYGWRAIYFMETYNAFLGSTGIFILSLNSLLFAIGAGLYLVMAYVGWEALARSQEHPQVGVIDAAWQRKFFVRETGSGLIHGFALGGLIVGLFTTMYYLLGVFYFQTDSQFGFSEPSIKYNLLTINMSAWTTTWFVAIVQIAFVYAIIHKWISNQMVSFLVSVVVVGILLASLGRVQGSSATYFEDVLVYLTIALATVAAYREYGLLTVATGWWFFTSVYMIMPYWNSSSIEVAYIGWTQAFIIAGPLIYGFIAYRFGSSLSEVGGYIPEYEERLAQQLRVEREIEIARESQYKLMPVQPPAADGFDVYGFFLPSFEVGGDYFDYVLSYAPGNVPKALTMAVVDVSGKAMRAAMPAIFTSGLLLSRMKEDHPAQILTEVSEPIFSRTDKRTFITCAIARYDLETKMLSVANAGHCKPVLKRNGKADFIQTPDPKFPLGLMPDVHYQSHEFKLKKGDFFLMYSDGLPEAVNEKGERFGFDEVPALLERIDTENLSANEIAQEIKRTVQKFSNYQLVDDTTIICLKV